MTKIYKLAKATVMVCMLMLAANAYAQEKTGFWNRGFGKFLKKVDNTVLSLNKSKVDTNYIGTSKYPHTLFLQGRQYNQLYDVHVPTVDMDKYMPDEMKNIYLPTNWQDVMFADAKLRSHKTSVQLGLSWGTTSIILPLPVVNNFDQCYGLASNGSVWGFTVRYRMLKNAAGTKTNGIKQMQDSVLMRISDWGYRLDNGQPDAQMDRSPIKAVPEDLANGDMSLRTFYADAYYVFNHKRFSLSAGRTGQAIQRRSAGSFIAMANFNQSQLRMNEMMYSERDYFRHTEFSLGLGYGYNWSLMDGRLCFHASFIPMFALTNVVKHRGTNIGYSHLNSETPDSTSEWFECDKNFYNAIDNHKHSKFTVNGFARLGANYHIGRMVLSASCDYRRYIFNNTANFKLKNRQLDFTLRCGWRF